jgi:hypothetical protein
VGHFKRELGAQFRIQGLGLQDLQLHVDLDRPAEICI